MLPIDTAHAPTLANPLDADITNITVRFQWTISGQPFYYQPQYRLASTRYDTQPALTQFVS